MINGTRTLLSVPLRKDEVFLGTIVAYRREVRPFTDKQIALLQNFAGQAVIAMENARLLTETREALEQQTATAEVLGVINSSPGDPAPVFDAILEKAFITCGAAYGTLTIFDGKLFRAVATRGLPESFETFLRQPFSRPAGAPEWRLVNGERYVHLPDIAAPGGAFDADDPVVREAVEAAGIRTLLFVPLRKDGALLGFITVHRTEVRPFTDKQIALLENFAAQAVIAMENARLITETREALDQQTATAEVLQVINASPGDLAPVFDAMLEKAMRLGEAVFGMMHTYDGEQFHTAATRGVPEAYTEYRKRNPAVISPGTGPARVLEGERVVHIVDLEAEEAYRSPESVNRALVDLAGARSILTTALHREDTLLGMLTIYRQEVRAFTDKQIALLENFAAQAVVAMENARLITETREALDQQTATAEVLGVINSSPGDLAPVFDAILEKAHALCGATQGVLVLGNGENFHAVAARGLPEEFAERLKRAFPAAGNPVAGPLLRGEPFVQLADLRQIDHPITQAGASIAGLRTLVAIALRKEGVVLGWIVAARREVRAFSDKEITLLQNFAAQAVIAMENARLLGELRQRTDEVAELNRGLEARVAAQLAELGRIGSLKRFLPPQVAEMVVTQGDGNILESHRREIVVVFADVRNYTTFTETAEPEEVIEFLGAYHAALGPLITRFEGTLSHFFGDGLMVFFNDPVPCPDSAQRAVNMAVAMRETAGELMAAWRRRGHRIGFGVGIAQGYATLGQIGFAERMDYTAIGTVTNLAARLCDAARDGQILISSRIATAVESAVTLEEMGDQSLKGLSQAVAIFNVTP
jgi:GAF domain-containing protein